MKVKQIAEDLNYIFSELVGTYNPETETGVPLYKEDLSNFIDVGMKITKDSTFNEHGFDHYVGKLIDRIGKTIIVDKKYESAAPDLEVDAVEWGANIQKVRIDDIDFVENPAWELTPGESYDYFDCIFEFVFAADGGNFLCAVLAKRIHVICIDIVGGCEDVVHHGNLHTQLEHDSVDPILGQRNLTADNRFQRRSQHPAVFFHVQNSDIVFNGIADEFTPVSCVCFFDGGIAPGKQIRT